MVIDRVARQLGDGARTDSGLAIFKRAEHELNYYPSHPPSLATRARRAVDITVGVSRATRSTRKSLPRMCSRFERPAGKSEGTDLRIRKVDRSTRRGISGTIFGREMGNSGNEEDHKYPTRGIHLRTCGGPFPFPPFVPFPPPIHPLASSPDLAEVRSCLTVSSAGRKGEAFCDHDPARALVLIRDIAMVPEDQYGNDE